MRRQLQGCKHITHPHDACSGMLNLALQAVDTCVKVEPETYREEEAFRSRVNNQAEQSSAGAIFVTRSTSLFNNDVRNGSSTTGTEDEQAAWLYVCQAPANFFVCIGQ